MTEAERALRDRATICPDCRVPLYLTVGIAPSSETPGGLEGPLVFQCICRCYPLSLVTRLPEWARPSARKRKQKGRP